MDGEIFRSVCVSMGAIGSSQSASIYPGRKMLLDVNTSSSEEAPDQISESQQVAHWGVPVERGRSSRRQNAMAHKSFERSEIGRETCRERV